MKAPLIFITYGLTNKICSFEENGIHKIPIFENLELAAAFVREFEKLGNELQREKPQPQICNDNRHILDIFTLISIMVQNPIISLNVGSENNIEYQVDEAIEAIQNHN